MTPYHLVSKESEVEEKIDISPALEAGQRSKENIIHLDRIRQGLDVRSTVGSFPSLPEDRFLTCLITGHDPEHSEQNNRGMIISHLFMES